MKRLLSMFELNRQMSDEQNRRYAAEFRHHALPATLVTLAMFALALALLGGVRLWHMHAALGPEGTATTLLSVATTLLWPAALLAATTVVLYLFRVRLQRIYPVLVFTALGAAFLQELDVWAEMAPDPEPILLGLLLFLPLVTVFLRLPLGWSLALGLGVYLPGIYRLIERFPDPSASAVAVTTVLLLSLFTAWAFDKLARRRFLDGCILEHRLQELSETRASLKDAKEQAEQNLAKYQTAQEVARLQLERRAQALESANRETTALREQAERALNSYKDVQTAALAQLESRTREAEQANASKALFLHKVSHDLKQPMSALGMQIEAARVQLEKGNHEGVRAAFPAIASSVTALNTTFGALLDISKIESGAQRPELGPTNIKLLLDELQQQFQPFAQSKQIRLRVRNLSKPPYHAYSDRAWLWRVLSNLASNAIKFTPRKDESSGVLIGAVACGGKVRIDVYDTGVGISAKDAPRIWEEFYKGQAIDDDVQYSAGLGLSIVRAICSTLDHPLDFRTEVGVGSRFSVHVPLSIEQPLFEPMALQFAVNGSLQGLTAVVVEDNMAVRQALMSLLTAWGVVPIGVASLQELQAYLLQHPDCPDMLVSDYRLGFAGTGHDAVVRLREHFAHQIPTVVVTGDLQLPHDTFAGMKGLRVLNKPVQPRNLHDTLVELVQASPLRPPLDLKFVTLAD